MQPQSRFHPQAPALATKVAGKPRLRPVGPTAGLGYPGIWQLIRRNALLILAITLASLTITYFSVRAQEPRYETVARIVLDPVSPQLDPGEAEVRQAVVSDAEMATELDVMRSRDFLLRVAHELNLFAEPDFNPLGVGRDPLAEPTAEEQEAVLARLMSSFYMNAARRALTIDIYVNETGAQRAADIANGLAEAFIAQSLEVQQGGMRQMADFLEERLTDLRTDLTKAELESATWIRFNELDDPTVQTDLLSDLDRVTAQIGIAGNDPQALAELRAERERIDAALRERSQAELRQVSMDRYLETLRTREGLLSNRYDALLVRLSLLTPSARQVSFAHVPLSPSSPNLESAMAGALVGSLAIGFVAAMLRASLDGRVWTGGAAGAVAGLGTLGRLPRAGRRAEAAGVAQALEDAVRPILAAARLRHGPHGPLALLIVSADRGEGRSTLALALAQSAASDGDEALVLDLEAKGHGTAELLGLARAGLDLGSAGEDAPLLVRTVARQGTAGDLSLLAPAVTDFLPRHIFAPRTGRRANQSGPGGLLARLGADHDLIVVDAPPLLAGDTSLRIAAHCDAVLVLFRPTRTPARRLREAAALLRRNGIEPLGLVENDA